MKITSIDRTNCRLLSDAMMAALKPLESQFGVKFNYNGGRFSDTNVTFKVEAAVVSSDGSVQNRERQDLIVMGGLYGLPKDVLDKPFDFNGDSFTVSGLKPRSHKLPVLAKCTKNGKTYKFSVDTIKRVLNIK